jgi:hypothetical protein
VRTRKLRFSCRFRQRVISLAVGLALSFCARPSSAQVSPSEILNPDLKALEESHFQQLKALNQSIAAVSLASIPRNRRRPIRAAWNSSALKIG